MKALRFDGKKLKLVKVPKPEPDEKEALIRVIKAGICSTDLEILKGYMGFKGTLGHEFVGEVEECEALPSLIGRRVVGEINCGCGWCGWCREGLARHCPNRTVLGIAGRDGSFAEYLTLPAWNLHEVSEFTSSDNAVFTEPLAAAFEILEQVHIKPGDTALLIGDGRLAQLITHVMTHHGICMDIVGKHKSKLRWLKRIASRIFTDKMPPPASYEYVIEASGSPSGWETAISAVQPRGTLILKSTFAEELTFNAATLVINEINVIGSRCGPFTPAVKLLADGFDPGYLIDDIVPFSKWDEAFEKADQSDSMKILLNIGKDIA